MRYVFVLLMLLAAGCSSDSDNGVLVDPGLDDNDGGTDQTDEIRFSTDVQPIFAASCAGSGCHVGGTASGVNLSSWSLATTTVGEQYGTPSILPGNAAGSPIVDKLGSSPRFGSRMPLGRGALSATSVQTIIDWIDAGALNN